MSLTSSLGMAGNSLLVNNIALQVVGQNLANANTPGYIRERVVLTPAPTQKAGGIMMGMGVQCKGVQQVVDEFLEHRLRSATSDLVNSETQEQTYTELEALVNELTENDLSTSVNNFFNSVSDVLNQPESVAVRNLAALQAERLARDANRLGDQIHTMQVDINSRIEEIGGEINDLTREIRDLNLKIAYAEGGDISSSDAVGLRDQRLVALDKLAQLINIRVEEQPTSGGVAVYCGSNFLVYEGIQRDVKVEYDTEQEIPKAEIRLVETDSPIDCTAGEYYGLQVSRDQILDNFSSKLDDFVATLIFEFNKIHASGQGLTGYSELTGATAVADPAAPLDSEELDLPFPIENGSLEVIVRNKKTGLSETHTIRVEMSDDDADEHDSLDDLVGKLDAISGIDASVTLSGRLELKSSAATLDFAFANDTSGALAVLGVNTFFTGSTARDIAVSKTMLDDPAKFAASQGGIGKDTENAVELADLPDKQLESKSNQTILSLYKQMANETAEGGAVAREQADADRVFQGTLHSQKLATSSVSIDEETIKLMTFQRAYQANAKYISTLSDLFNVLIDL